MLKVHRNTTQRMTNACMTSTDESSHLLVGKRDHAERLVDLPVRHVILAQAAVLQRLKQFHEHSQERVTHARNGTGGGDGKVNGRHSCIGIPCIATSISCVLVDGVIILM